MKKLLLALGLASAFSFAHAQPYFPPIIGSNWDTMAPSELGWCPDRIDSLYEMLDDGHTKSFIILKDGKIVLEKYFDAFTKDSFWYWASAGKTLTAFLIGVAQEEGLLDITDKTSDHLGVGWTNCPPAKEDLITVQHQLTMTTGLDDWWLTADCLDSACLNYEADAGTRWAYHNAPYTLLTHVIEAASGQTYNAYSSSKFLLRTGIAGLWVQLGTKRVFFSNTRAMARYGLLILNNGVWNGDTLLHDSDYINDMITTSQNINLSYGYLWWLNGKTSHMLPLSQNVFSGPLLPDAPADLYTGAGKDGQYVNVVPSENMVVVRMGENPDSSAVPVDFNNKIWQYINQLQCATGVETVLETSGLKVYPNPASETLTIESDLETDAVILNVVGKTIKRLSLKAGSTNVAVDDFPAGLYFLQASSGEVVRVLVE